MLIINPRPYWGPQAQIARYLYLNSLFFSALLTWTDLVGERRISRYKSSVQLLITCKLVIERRTGRSRRGHRSTHCLGLRLRRDVTWREGRCTIGGYWLVGGEREGSCTRVRKYIAADARLSSGRIVRNLRLSFHLKCTWQVQSAQRTDV